MIEFVSQAHQYFLANDGLDNIDEIFQKAGKGYGADIQAAVQEEQLLIAQVDRLIDNAFLHLQGKNPEEQADDDDEQQQELKSSMAPGYPIK